ncbi:hypothetical protein CAPTEDRAFT_212415 [Capitella teleta]|uniref:Polycystin cation channel PKD1/PKD2 domain-containing protein n=1 Tax=Capitella teleta TaxID=283909 RepID=R7TWB4_CAPTE|nr:hypothetical protein CAPTEDRAFT_212415 [Capitella teleta]|eukprot:ELT98208.1 hypothetical protein CAPTEDRAFT_212415 [Capitella teleta]
MAMLVSSCVVAVVWLYHSVLGFFCALYSQAWGKEKFDEWLTTVTLSCLLETCVTNPLKMLKFNKRMTTFFSVLSVLCSDLWSFMAILGTSVVAHAFLETLLFGYYVNDYSSILHCVGSLLSTVFGKNQTMVVTMDIFISTIMMAIP